MSLNEQRHEPDTYLAERLRRALAQDARLGEFDLQVTVRGGGVWLTGHVATAGRRAAISDVTGEVLPQREVRNETVLDEFPESRRREQVR